MFGELRQQQPSAATAPASREAAQLVCRACSTYRSGMVIGVREAPQAYLEGDETPAPLE